MNIEEELVDKAISINYDDLPSEVVLACKKSVVDLIGVAIAGATTPVAKKLFEVVSQGRTIKEVEENLKEAVQLILESPLLKSAA
jgi:2-methylcitrate dehydratase PrpD